MSAIILHALALGASSVAAKGSFCEEMVVHDFGKPFDRMPRVHPPPPSGQLPFAPGHTHLNQPRSQILVAAEGPRIGYGFDSDPGADRTFKLNWRILGRVSQINGRGKVKKLIAAQKQSVGTVSEAEFNRISLRFWVPPREGLYRLDLSFRRKNGELLKHYSQYFRVVKPTVSVRLNTDRASVHTGEDVMLRVENFGSTHVRYGEPFSVERFEGSAWAPFPPELGPWHRNLRQIGSGEAGLCQSFTVPSEMPAGLYRFKKQLASPARNVTANFEVLP